MSRRVSYAILLVAMVLWLLPVGAIAGRCTAANGATCECGAGFKCFAGDDHCGCVAIEK